MRDLEPIRSQLPSVPQTIVVAIAGYLVIAGAMAVFGKVFWLALIGGGAFIGWRWYQNYKNNNDL